MTFDEWYMANERDLENIPTIGMRENFAMFTKTKLIAYNAWIAATSQIQINQPIMTANLGLATTGQLIDELRARCEVNGTIHYKTVTGYSDKEGQDD